MQHFGVASFFSAFIILRLGADAVVVGRVQSTAEFDIDNIVVLLVTAIVGAALVRLLEIINENQTVARFQDAFSFFNFGFGFSEEKCSDDDLDDSADQPLSEVEVADAYGVPLSALEELGLDFPESPPAERARYLVRRSAACCPEKAAQLLRAYLTRRIDQMPQLPHVPDALPKILRFNGHARDGTRLVHFMPSAIDLQYSPEVYASAVVQLMEYHIPRESTTRLTILFDTRAHDGCPNNSFWKLCRHLSVLATTFQHYFPERVACSILFPVSSQEQKAYNAFSYVLQTVSPTLGSKLNLVFGSHDGPLPMEIWNYFRQTEIWPENLHLFPTRRRPSIPSESIVADVYGVPLPALEALAVDFPDSPPAERARYLARKSVSHCPKKAADALRAYFASRINVMANWPPAPAGMPNCLRFNGHARDGTRLVHFIPSAIDLQFSAEAYAISMVRLVDSQLARESTTRLTILCDTRPHEGCPNNICWKLWRHLHMLATMFQHYFPERVQRGIVFPVSGLEQHAYNAFSYVLSPASQKKVVLAWGSQSGPLPVEISEYVDASEIWPENRYLFPGM